MATSQFSLSKDNPNRRAIIMLIGGLVVAAVFLGTSLLKDDSKPKKAVVAPSNTNAAGQVVTVQPSTLGAGGLVPADTTFTRPLTDRNPFASAG